MFLGKMKVRSGGFRYSYRMSGCVNPIWKVVAPCLFLLLLMRSNVNNAQPFITNLPGDSIYTDTIIARIDITIHPDSLINILNNPSQDIEHTATFKFSSSLINDSLPLVGFSLRGNTSRYAEKKSFKVSFNSYLPSKKFFSLEKMNLNGEHNDPTVQRANTYWRILETMGVPGPRASHVLLYINQLYYGVYLNVEHVDENFIAKRFRYKNGNLYKCLYPANLDFLSNDPNDYAALGGGNPVYDQQQGNGDYSDLAHLVDFINNFNGANYRDSLEKLVNVNALLKAYAIDVITGNWDNYAFNQNNYYLYKNPQTELFEYLPYDVDNTFGIDWFNIDWASRNIYSWYGSNNRKLISRLFNYQDYKDRFSFFVNRGVTTIANNGMIDPWLDSVRIRLQPFVAADSFYSLDYGYSTTDFFNSFDQSLGAHVKYGLKEFIGAMANHVAASIDLNPVPPIISEVRHQPIAPQQNDTLYVSALIEDELTPDQVFLKYKIGYSGQLDSVQMNDSGLNYDGLPNDGIFGAAIPYLQSLDTIYYFITNEDLGGLMGRAPRSDFYSVPVTPVTAFYINEVMAANTNTIADEAGEFDDYIEIYNAGVAATTYEIYITDDSLNKDKWQLPDTILPSASFQLLWADEDKAQGKWHTNFKVNAAAESIYLWRNKGWTWHLLDEIHLQNEGTDVSRGSFPDGSAIKYVQSTPTPRQSNVITLINDQSTFTHQIYPNPIIGSGQLNLVGFPITNGWNYSLIDLWGRTVAIEKLSEGQSQIQLDQVVSGCYILKITNGNTKFQTNLVVIGNH